MDMSVCADCGNNLADIVQCFVIAVALVPILALVKRVLFGRDSLVLQRIA
jgi:hypothetical protein